MLRRFITFCILITLVLFALVLVSPVKAEMLATRMLKSLGTFEAWLPLEGYKEPILKVVDPAAISSAIKEEVPIISSFFKKDEPVASLSIEDIIDETNKARIKEGVPPLTVNLLLSASAKLKTDDMIALQYFEHESPTGVMVSDLGREVGYDYIIMGENLALGSFDGAADLVDAWMNSPGHRANILNPLYQEIGVYAARGTYEGHEVWFAVQHFGARRSACPEISKSLKTEIDALNANLDVQQNEIETLKKEIEATAPGTPGYNEKVDHFNALVAAYNQVLLLSREKIASYNKQVAQFNACLSKYQK